MATAPAATVLIGDDRVEPGSLGGKGGALATLIDAAYPVPATGVVTIAAYRRIATEPGIARLIDSIRSGAEHDADEVDRVFLDADVPSDLVTEILTLAERVGEGGQLAVRSSATVEDLTGSSFAGQYRSLLEIDAGDAAQVLRAVRLVWASLWHPAPTAYRRAFGIDDAEVAMAVVLMRMIPATSAGVVFTVDPGGAPASARIESVRGLGEELVSGRRTPSAWVARRDDPSSLPPVPERALELALAIEETQGVPQDVEWAAVDDQVYVVQARPITVLESDDGFDAPVDDHELTTAGILEMVPGVLPPLRWEINRFLLDEAFRSVLDSLGLLRGSETEMRSFVRRVRGRAALDFAQLRGAASAVPGAVEELERQYFGESPDRAEPAEGEAPAAAQSRRASIRRAYRALRTRRTAVDAADVLVATVAAVGRNRPDLAAQHDPALLGYVVRALDLAARGLAAELAVAADAAADHSRLEATLAPHLGVDEAAAAVRSVTVGAGTMAVRTSASSASVFAGPTWNEIEAEPVVPPEPDPGRDAARLAELEQRLKAVDGWTRRRILTGQVVDIRLHLVRRLVADVRSQLARREQAKAAFLELGGEVRRVLLELGARHVQTGALTTATDIELLSLAELHRLVAEGEGPGSDVLRSRRGWIGRYEAEGELPVRFSGVPDRQPTPLPEGDVLEGWAASPGRRRGRAQVVTGPTDDFVADGVLVAAATDASWSPLFLRAAAIVVERGGPLSHAAILARELGIPAVLNVAGATERLDGLAVSVDGDQGLVVIER